MTGKVILASSDPFRRPFALGFRIKALAGQIAPPKLLAISSALSSVKVREICGLGKGPRVAGTLGILSMAAEHGLINLADAFERIKQTNFHHLQETMDQLLAESGSDHRP